jgi:hypothetical protein
MSQACPDESDLLALLQEESVPLEVRAHVDGCSSCQRVIAALRSEVSTLRMVMPGARPSQSPIAASGSERPPFIGKYFIAGALRETDRFVSYRAAHAVLYQEVVLTLAKQTQITSAADRQALANRARPVLAFTHPIVARTLDFDFWEDRPYVVEEYHPGGSIEEAATRDRRSAARTCEQVARLAEALVAIRAAGLVELDAQTLRPISDVAGALWLTGLGEAWLDRALAPEPDASSSSSFNLRDAAVLGRWLVGALLSESAEGTAAAATGDLLEKLRHAGVKPPLAWFCVNCIAENPDVPRSAAEFLAELEQLAQRPFWPWALAAVLAVGGLAAAWMLLG